MLLMTVYKSHSFPCNSFISTDRAVGDCISTSSSPPILLRANTYKVYDIALRNTSIISVLVPRTSLLSIRIAGMKHRTNSVQAPYIKKALCHIQQHRDCRLQGHRRAPFSCRGQCEKQMSILPLKTAAEIRYWFCSSFLG